MKIKANKFELFKDIGQFEIDSNHFCDLHNDFNCINIFFENKTLSLIFEALNNKTLFKLVFNNVDLEKFNFIEFSKSNNLTLDTLYRGRFEKMNRAFEFSDSGKSIFYLEFYEGLKMEFWCDEFQADMDIDQ